GTDTVSRDPTFACSFARRAREGRRSSPAIEVEKNRKRNRVWRAHSIVARRAAYKMDRSPCKPYRYCSTRRFGDKPTRERLIETAMNKMATERRVRDLETDPVDSPISLDAFYAGNKEALTHIYREHFAAVDRAVGRILSQADKETVVHEVFFRL